MYSIDLYVSISTHLFTSYFLYVLDRRPKLNNYSLQCSIVCTTPATLSFEKISDFFHFFGAKNAKDKYF